MRGGVRGKAGEQREATSDGLWGQAGFHFRAVRGWEGFKCSSRKTSKRLQKRSSKSVSWGGSNATKEEGAEFCRTDRRAALLMTVLGRKEKSWILGDVSGLIHGPL